MAGEWAASAVHAVIRDDLVYYIEAMAVMINYNVSGTGDYQDFL